jgi:hypothetical protein
LPINKQTLSSDVDVLTWFLPYGMSAAGAEDRLALWLDITEAGSSVFAPSYCTALGRQQRAQEVVEEDRGHRRGIQGKHQAFDKLLESHFSGRVGTSPWLGADRSGTVDLH